VGAGERTVFQREREELLEISIGEESQMHRRRLERANKKISNPTQKLRDANRIAEKSLELGADTLQEFT
jgi:hypothetical protein